MYGKCRQARTFAGAVVARIERKYYEVNIISQELALHGRVCKYDGMLLFEASHTRLRATSAKIAGISTMHEAYVEDLWLPRFELSDSIYMTTFIVFQLKVRPSLNRKSS